MSLSYESQFVVLNGLANYSNKHLYLWLLAACYTHTKKPHIKLKDVQMYIETHWSIPEHISTLIPSWADNGATEVRWIEKAILTLIHFIAFFVHLSFQHITFNEPLHDILQWGEGERWGLKTKGRSSSGRWQLILYLWRQKTHCILQTKRKLC